MEMIISKRCTKCGKTKPVTEFYLRYEKRRDPYKSYCKACAKENMGNWYEENSEYQKKKSKKWRLSNLLHCLLRDKKYNEEHKEKKSKQHKKWKEANHDKVIQLNRNRRARGKNANGSYTAEEFRELCAKYDYRCLCCREKKKLTADHVVSLDEGGTNYISNIQPLCGSCNSRKKNKTIDYRKAWQL